ncbi:hypothetical protein P22_3950 [Propionispora sp. 2/2-37]|uniref:helix-turn-helix domain-containing protein n=1 Tax=Propionispora sp. 2/2-37 TaxID=1677858 RepID=UPI0006BB8355|nr:helix-turn-helix transcriptional regulator [Propionispora sp. 2/2-37]CUH97804.1 hypothetical protein P22_3950 [Propionispora sp. 2/2-37]
MLKPNNLNTLGNRLLFLRQSAHITLQKLSEKTGLSSSNLSRYEKDEVKPSADAIVTLCNFYRVSTDWLLLGSAGAGPAGPSSNVVDPDLQKMFTILQQLMNSSDPDLRGWTKIQFQKAFGEYYAAEEKKHRA